MAILRLSVGGGAVTTKVQRWGNSQGVRIRKDLLESADLVVGDEVEVEVRDGGLVITPARRIRGRQSLAQLVREIPAGYRPEELEWGAPAGREVG
jgi:antitoxin MazE